VSFSKLFLFGGEEGDRETLKGYLWKNCKKIYWDNNQH
jgi:hypothetical protein